MARFIQLRCADGGCTGDSGCCPIGTTGVPSLTRSGSGPNTPHVALDETVDLNFPWDQTVYVIWNFFSPLSDRLRIYDQDDVELYDTTCVIGNSFDSFVVPAGTSALRLLVNGSCAGSGAVETLWTFSLQCASPV